MPLRFITGYKTRKVKFVEADVKDIDPVSKTVTFADDSDLKGEIAQAAIKFDYLITAVGAENATFGIPGGLILRSTTLTTSLTFVPSILLTSTIRRFPSRPLFLQASAKTPAS